MKICSRCNKEVAKIDVVCPRCGFSLVKDKYGKRVDPITNVFNGQETINFNNNKNYSINNKNKTVLAIFIIFLFAIAGFFPAYIILMNADNVTVDETSIIDVNLINDFIYDVKVIASDYNLAWDGYKKNNDITLNQVDDIIELNIDEMNDDSCTLFKDSAQEMDLLNCVLKTYETNGGYEDVNSDMMNLYEYVQVYEYGDVRDVLVEVYGYAYDLYYLPGSVDNYEQYKNKYDETLNSLNKMMNLLEDYNL